MNKNFRQVLTLVFVLISFTSGAQFSIPGYGNQNVIGGYEKNIEGELLPYFSSYQQFATVALLTRCTDGNKIITWQSAPAPKNFNKEYAWFYCLAGHSTGTSTADRNFDLYINGEYYLTITTPQKRKPPFTWSFVGRDSVTAIFDAKVLDIHTDVFGGLFLRIPKKLITPGQPLTFSLKGKNENSNDWFMIFQYQYIEKIVVEPSPLLVQTKEGIKQIIIVKTDHTYSTTDTLKLQLPARPYLIVIHPGANYTELPVDTFTKVENTKVIATIGNKFKTEMTVRFQPAHRREVDLIHHSHNDIGYSNYQEEVAKTQNQNIRNALKLIEQTKDYPDGCRFIWNIESLWAVDNFLQEATVGEKEKFFDAVRKNQIALSGHYANLMTGLCKPEELNWMLEYGVWLRNTYKLPINSVMLTDVPGVSWSEVQALADNGFKYFSNGPNYIPVYPDGGERIGGTLREFGDKPFYWKSENGKSKILFWTTGRGYSFFHTIPYSDLDEKRRDKIVEYLNELDSKNYPYDIIQLRYSIKNDNGPTDSTLCDFVRSWNKKYISPKLVIANVNDMMQRFEKRYGKKLPVLSGDFTPYWEDGAYSTAKEEAQTRELSEKIIQLQKLYAMMPDKNLDTNLFYNARRNVVMFHEHTWGSWNSISDPDIPFTTKQWAYKKRFCDSAAYYVSQIENVLLHPSKDFKFISVVNTLPWKRSGYVEFDAPANVDLNFLMSAENKAVLIQKLKNGRFCFYASDIPPNNRSEFKLIVHKKGESLDSINSLLNGQIKVVINENFTNSFDKKTGAINSLKLDGVEWNSTTSSFKNLMQAIYVEGVANTDLPKQYFTEVKNIELVDLGLVTKSYKVTCTMQGCNEVQYIITQYNGTDVLKLSAIIDKKAIREKESIQIAFPFNLKNVTTRIGVGDTCYTPEHGQLKGSNKDYYSVQRWIDVSDVKQGVTITSPQCALFEVGSIIDERKINQGNKLWKTTNKSSSTIFAYTMNNYWSTNFKADQEGVVQYDFYLNFHKAFSKKDALRFGIEMNQPLLVICRID
ncbi:MAG: glycoside hydrolase [Bacteroidia bacterium]